MIETADLQRAVERAGRHLKGNDREFFRRVWATDPEIYRARLRAVGFSGLERVLDAGSGMGQWTVPLAELNGKVNAVDVSAARIAATRELARELGVANLEVDEQSVEELKFPDETFDAVFCYSVIMMTDFRKTVREFHRVLKPGGRVYICANGLGYYVHNIVDEPNRSVHYDPRMIAIETIQKSLEYYATGKRFLGSQLVIPSKILIAALRHAGFGRSFSAGEGTLQVADSVSPRSFYVAQYAGVENVYEVVAWKDE
jgi:ubiquinone/menaquinone biosynthesis C-methylase UbiE